MLTRIAKFRACALLAVLTGLVVAPAAMAEPMVKVVHKRYTAPPTTAQCEAAIDIACYNAAQFRHAYGTDQLNANGITGKGQTIVIVDSYGSPTIKRDLQVYDKENGLPKPPSLKIIAPSGRIPKYNANDPNMGGWAFEATLDVDMAHTMAPGANILLVETPVAETTGVTGFPQMMNAEQYVIDHHMGNVISQSFAAGEVTFSDPATQIGALRYAYEDAAAHNVTVVSATGDQGPTTAEPDQVDYYPMNEANWPATDPLVTAVGGTQLNLDASGNRTAPDNVWNDTYNPNVVGPNPSPAAGGGGLSTVFGRPSYQNGVAGVVGNSRGEPDISASAAVNGGANIYIGFTNPAYGITATGWYIVGGTSEATPLTAGIISLADQVAGHGLGEINPTLYQMAANGDPGITDIAAGNNGVSFTNSGGSDDGSYTLAGFSAGAGYDLASGLGTPSARQFVYELAAGS